MADLGELKAKITAEVDGFIKDMNKAADSVNDFSKDAEKGTKEATKGFSGMSTAAKMATVAAAAMVAVKAVQWLNNVAREAMNAADEHAKLARQLGLTNRELAIMDRAAQFAGMSVQEIANNSRRLNQALVEATENGGKSAEAFEKLGLSASSLIDLDMEQQLTILGEALTNIESRAQRSAIANDLFGRSGQRMLVLLDGAGETFKRAADEVDRFGLGLKEVDTRTIEAANDNFNSINAAIGSLAQQFAATIAPSIERASSAILNFVGRIAESNRELQEFIRASARLGTDQEQKEDRLTVLLSQRVRMENLLASSRRQNDYETTNSMQEQLRLQDLAIAAERRKLAALERSQALEQQGATATAANAAAAAAIAEEEARQAQAAADRHQMHLDNINEAYAQTAKGQEEALRAQIAYFSSFQVQGPKTIAILEMLNEQLEQMTKAPDEGPTAENPFIRQLAQLREFVMDAQEMEIHRHAQRMAILEAAQADESTAVEDYHELREALEREHQERLATIIGQGNDNKKKLDKEYEDFTIAHYSMLMGHASSIANSIVTIFDNAGKARIQNMEGTEEEIQAAMDKHAREQFEISKTLATAQAIVDGISATVSSYRAGASIGGPVLGAAFASVAAAATGAQVAAIRSSSFSGSGTVTGPPSGGGASTPSAPQGQLFINLQGGDMFSGSQVRDLMDRIAEAQNDGYMVVV